MPKMKKIKDFEKDLALIFREDLPSYQKSADLYRSLCNTFWEKEGEEVSYSWRAAGGLVASLRNDLALEPMDPGICQNCGQSLEQHIIEKRTIKPFFSEEEFETTSHYCTSEKKEHFIEGYRGSEDYLDFYCSGREGEVADWIQKKMNEAGYISRSG